MLNVVTLSVVMLSVAMLSVAVLSVVMLSVVMLSVAAPNIGFGLKCVKQKRVNYTKKGFINLIHSCKVFFSFQQILKE
jgi:hypothetical protein